MEGFCYHGDMDVSCKNPRIGLLMLFLLAAGAGVFLFRGKSTSVIEKANVERNAESFSEESGFPKESSEDLVKKIEEGNTAPGESESGGESDDTASQAVTDESTAVSRSIPPEGSLPTKAIEPVKDAKESAITPGASNPKEGFSIENRLASWGFAKAIERKIDTVVIHSTYNATGGDPFSVSKIIDIYKSYGVSPHYLVARDGTVYRMVEEKNIAYHAGESEMPDGRKNVNAFSIGIEVIGKDNGGPSDAQYDALKKLLADIETRQTIKHVLGHSDIAPGRKSDPWGFDWKKIGGKEL